MIYKEMTGMLTVQRFSGQGGYDDIPRITLDIPEEWKDENHTIKPNITRQIEGKKIKVKVIFEGSTVSDHAAEQVIIW